MLNSVTTERDGSAVASAMNYHRTREPNLARVARETTGGIVNTEWARQDMRDALRAVPYRDHHKFLWKAWNAATARMEAEQAAIGAYYHRIRNSPQWDDAPQSDRDVFTVICAVGQSEGPLGGPRVMAAHRPTAETIYDEIGHEYTPMTISNSMSRLAVRGWLQVERGQGYSPGKRTRSTVYLIPLQGEDFTSPLPGKRACKGRAGRSFFERLSDAFEEAVRLIRRMKTCPGRPAGHLPMSWFRSSGPDEALAAADLAEILEFGDPPGAGSSLEEAA
jgi:hypothetical protein